MTQSDMMDTTSVKHPVSPTFQVRHRLRSLRLGAETGGDTYDCLKAQTPHLVRGRHVRKEGYAFSIVPVSRYMAGSEWIVDEISSFVDIEECCIDS